MKKDKRLSHAQELEIGVRIRALREAQKKTRDDMAYALDCSEKFCKDIELGNSGFTLRTLLLLSDFLNVSTDYILTGKHSQDLKDPILEGLNRVPAKKREYALKMLNLFILACQEE